VDDVLEVFGRVFYRRGFGHGLLIPLLPVQGFENGLGVYRLPILSSAAFCAAAFFLFLLLA
jgi:hypothetical protein